MKVALRELKLKDRGVFEKHLRFSQHELSVYAFENIYIWRGLFEIRWALIAGALCVFFKDAIGCFLYLAPLCRKMPQGGLQKIFSVMDMYNKNPAFSHIENIEEADLAAFPPDTYRIKAKGVEFVCKRTDLAGLKGDAFKSKRWAANYFTSHTDRIEYVTYTDALKAACLRLYEEWATGRRQDHTDPLYRAMLEDNYSALQVLLKDFRHFKFLGRVVKIGGRVQAFTFAFPLTQKTLCVAYEIANLDYKGLAQFMFRQLCRELSEYEYINIMDDSGLESLRQVKLSYRPLRCAPSFIVTRYHG
ncbi:MAG: phosphatidylglycerol lysyltransferase domain-containing protein [Candidatus Omnitrophica bacterium]|nr:phosphatidylglycerol lysyltransferase domain-containing protein [Candidatus Omnitrophota bacterium]